MENGRRWQPLTDFMSVLNIVKKTLLDIDSLTLIPHRHASMAICETIKLKKNQDDNEVNFSNNTNESYKSSYL